MQIQKLVFSVLLVVTFSSTASSFQNVNTLLDGYYHFDVVVLDQDGKYPVSIEFNSLGGKVTQSIIDYPLYNCRASIFETQIVSDGLLFMEKMTKGEDKCLPSAYRFVISGLPESTSDYIVKAIFNLTDGTEVPVDILKSAVSYSPLSVFLINNKIKSCASLEQTDNIDLLRQYVELFRGDLGNRQKTTVPQCKGVNDRALVLTQETNSLEGDLLFMKSFQNSKGIDAISNRALSRILVLNEKETLNDFILICPIPEVLNRAIDAVYSDVVYKNTIKEYTWFIDKYPRHPSAAKAKKATYLLIKKSNSVKDYAWFIDKYPKYSLITKIEDDLYSLVKKKNSIKDYSSFIKKYPEYASATKAKEAIYLLVTQRNKIKDYLYFIDNYQSYPSKGKAEEAVFKIIKKQHNVVGYEWFIKRLPEANQVKEAIQTIHRMAFNEAVKINTISAYNTFIISYPFAKQIKRAIVMSYDQEAREYRNNKKDEESTARLLAVKIKKMKIASNRMSDQNRIGYDLIIDRMVKLLTEQYEATDASLRYYESQEFIEFGKSFEKSMSSMKNILNQIARNTSISGQYTKRLIEITEQGFASAKADRDMTEYREKAKDNWDKWMHLEDTGYM